MIHHKSKVGTVWLRLLIQAKSYFFLPVFFAGFLVTFFGAAFWVTAFLLLDAATVFLAGFFAAGADFTGLGVLSIQLMIASPNSEHLISFAPSIRRAKS